MAEVEEIQEKLEALSVQQSETEWLRNSVLGKQIKVLLTDSREIIGKLQCADHLANVVLIQATEVISPQVSRNLGNVIIPSKGIQRVFLLTSS
jgi:small nuclear ribonucleoprotein (snRNP)-like protein